MKKVAKKKYKKPTVYRIKLDYQQLVKSATGGGGGCPYVYVWDGEGYCRETNILPQSENLTISGDRTDYYVLQNTPVPRDGFLTLKLKEIDLDISYFNSFKLLTVEYPQGYNLTFDFDKKPVFFKELILPHRSRDHNGEDRLQEITNKNWVNPGRYFNGTVGDSLEVELSFPQDAEHLDLVIIDPYDERIRLVGICTREMIHCFKSILISIEGIDKTFVLNTRSIFYPDAIELTPYLPQLKQMGKVKINIHFTAPHKISLIGLNTVKINDYQIKEYQLQKAIHSRLEDVTYYLKEDNCEYISLYPGEELELYFPLPVECPYQERNISYVLVGKGFYIPVRKINGFYRPVEKVAHLEKIAQKPFTVNA